MVLIPSAALLPLLLSEANPAIRRPAEQAAASPQPTWDLPRSAIRAKLCVQPAPAILPVTMQRVVLQPALATPPAQLRLPVVLAALINIR